MDLSSPFSIFFYFFIVYGNGSKMLHLVRIDNGFILGNGFQLLPLFATVLYRCHRIEEKPLSLYAKGNGFLWALPLHVKNRCQKKRQRLQKQRFKNRCLK